MPSASVSHMSGIHEEKQEQTFFSLQRVLLILVLCSIAFPALISGGILIFENYTRTIEIESRSKADNYIELLQAGMQMPLWNIAPGLGEPLLDSIKVDTSVVEIEVLGTNAQPFLYYQNPNMKLSDEHVYVNRNVIYNNEKLGEVKLYYSLAEATERASEESQLLLIILSVQLIFSISLLTFFLSRRVTSPLSLLESAAAGIAKGDLDTQIPKLNNDEFGNLATELEHMRGELSRLIHNLENRVKERTQDLEGVNKELHGALDRLKMAQGELVQQEKLAALGSLVAGIAHELNTPIGNGRTVASTLADWTAAITKKLEEGITKSDLDRYLRDMTEGVAFVCLSLEKASELVSSFKQVAMDRTSAQRRNFSISSLLKETEITMTAILKHQPYKIDISIEDDVMLDSYPGPLGQVISNLLNNAMLHGFYEREEGNVAIKVSKQDDRVLLTVSDDGHGIEEENIKYIFDPFFTTKLGEGGSGLGMHIVHNIVTAVLGGTIDVESAPEKGTTFLIRIPIVAPSELSDGKLSNADERSVYLSSGNS